MDRIGVGLLFVLSFYFAILERKMALYLVSCVSKKLEVAAEAKDLYVSALFLKARAYVENRDERWFILSAKYGLVHPEQVIEPYNLTLNSMGVADRRLWSERVMAQIQPHLNDVSSVVFLAGQKYRELLELEVASLGVAVQVPMKGLSIGRQLNWLDRHALG